MVEKLIEIKELIKAGKNNEAIEILDELIASEQAAKAPEKPKPSDPDPEKPLPGEGDSY